MEEQKKDKGITLIALVITIIVLLILAGVSIAMLTGDNGILTQAQRAKGETENAAANEAAILNEYNQIMSNWTKGETSTGGESESEIYEILKTTLPVTVNVNGGDISKYAGVLQFELRDENKSLISKATSDEDGNIDFGEFTFTKPGDYTYYIKQIGLGEPYTTYDDSEYEVTFKVIAEGNKLNVEIWAKNNKDPGSLVPEISFLNTVAPPPPSN